MGYSPVPAKELWPALKQALGLPDGVTKFMLRLEVDAIATIEVERFVMEGEAKEIKSIVERYHFVKADDDTSQGDGGG